MTQHVALRHRTAYRYDRPISMGPQTIRLRPAPHCRTRILSYGLTVNPGDHFLNWLQDPHGNFLARVNLHERTDAFSVDVDLIAEMAVINPFDFFIEPQASEFPFTYDARLARDLQPCLSAPPAGKRLAAWLASVDRRPRRSIDFVVELNTRLRTEIDYLVRMEPGVRTPEETLELGRGSCRDSAWLLVHILRHLGLAARFASGYLIQLTPDVKALDGPSGAEADFTDLHAWAEVFLPGAGWIGLDPTSGLLAGEGHLPLACTPEPGSAAPIEGATEPADVEFEFEMSVERVWQQPRVTKPLPERAWAGIDALGEAVDAELEAGDVRLTLGGEPTFVAIDTPDDPEWTVEAVGPTKRPMAEDLIRRLKDRFAPDGLLHYGQGKWYPGESVPRWALSLYWRGDGKPLWQRNELIARQEDDHAPTIARARSLVAGIARRLGLDPSCAVEAYEDTVGYLSRRLAVPVGIALPLRPWQAADRANPERRWLSEKWKLREGRLHLIPGDSAMGLRLPLSALPRLEAADQPALFETDPAARRVALAATDPRRQTLRSADVPDRPAPSAQEDGPDGPSPVGGTVRTALAVEPREGRLCVFLPPVEDAEDYADLLAAIEGAAGELATPIHIEGYAPPPDPRLDVIKVTPDPGVIEVNIHPARSWRQAVAATFALYEEARRSRLGTRKFLVDGRHTGTRGGNHIVLGGTTPLDSPFLRRPDLLASFIAYWQNHPSLSYLFSGLFIGPTSRAPRFDEARKDSLHEMEIALDQVPPMEAGTALPWITDRLFRNLLVDLTGNTHRAEIGIDKLFSPDGPTGRLGLVEFRAFEMPPHPQMSLIQQLLLRALVARFWRTPCRRGLVRWGTTLHDRFMLPHFVWSDFLDVLGELRAAGFDFDPEWFAAQFEFRFPMVGTVTRSDVMLELRTAIEPWIVLGEQATGSGTARHVDSSVERLQVRAEGLTPERYRISCNGRALPLHGTGRHGEFVAGVRYRAWQPASCLHPLIGVHTPLTFDIVDLWNGRSVGGCTYHVSHPGGHAHETRPVNAYEAEGRRLARFSVLSHTAGSLAPAPVVPNPDFPLTLDLRVRSGRPASA